MIPYWVYINCAFLLWVVGACIAYGIVGGIRDEMDGIGDSFCVFCWPLALVGWVAISFCGLLVNCGGWISQAIRKSGR